MHRRGGWVALRPRGPRSGPGYAVPVRPRLIGPIRPTRRHIATSPHGGLYAMPSLCGSAEATREWFRAFATIPSWHAVLSDHGEFGHRMCPVRDADAAFAEFRTARHSQHSRNPFHAGSYFRGFTGSQLLRPARLLAPLDGSDWVSPATGGFYIQASGGSVALPAAGYDYNSHWTPLLAGLSPAGMAASLAAPEPVIETYEPLYLSPQDRDFWFCSRFRTRLAAA